MSEATMVTTESFTRCLAHFKRDGLRVWCMLDAGHDGPHRVWQGALDEGASAWAFQWNETATERRAR